MGGVGRHDGGTVGFIRQVHCTTTRCNLFWKAFPSPVLGNVSYFGGPLWQLIFTGFFCLFSVSVRQYPAIVFSCCKVRWLNVSLQMFSSVYVVPVFQSFWISVSVCSLHELVGRANCESCSFLKVLAGMVFFGEYEGIFNDAEKSIFFPTGMIITISGVAILSKREQQQRKGLNENTKLMPE